MKAFSVILLLGLLTAVLAVPVPDPLFWGKKHEHYVFHVPYKVKHVHHHHVEKVPVYVKSSGWAPSTSEWAPTSSGWSAAWPSSSGWDW